MADVERESNNNDQIQKTNTPEKDNEIRSTKVLKINNQNRKRRRSSSSSFSSSSSSSDEKREKVKRKENS